MTIKTSTVGASPKTTTAPSGSGKLPPIVVVIPKTGPKNKAMTVKAKLGQDIVIKCPFQAGTGYQWKVTVQSRGLGQPTSKIQEAKRPGGPAIEVLTYKTKGLISAVGEHQVSLRLMRSWNEGHSERRVDLSIKVSP